MIKFNNHHNYNQLKSIYQLYHARCLPDYFYQIYNFGNNMSNNLNKKVLIELFFNDRIGIERTIIK